MKHPAILLQQLLPGLLLLWATANGFAQQTVGVLSQTGRETAGYNLFFPNNQDKVFLVDNNGQLVHHWDDPGNFLPGMSVYLLPNGNLLRCKRPNTKTQDPIYAPGAGGVVEIVDWKGNLLHEFILNNDTARLHHDIEPLPNGNVLLVAWEKFDYEACLQAGRDPATMAQDNILSEMILEWDPQTGQVVWEWHAWDHLVQDRFPDRQNYGGPALYPGKINLNYDEHDGHPDWLHINSIDYNPVLDQIVVSVPFFNELWVIDHSTTTAQAATAQGGNAGKGGEILFRFGNDKTWRDTPGEQQLFFQHDIHWLDENATAGAEDFGKMLLFNNRMPDTTSVGMLLTTLEAGTASYLNPQNPADLILKTYRHPLKPEKAYSSGLSNAQKFENGHVLLFSGRYGYAFELDASGEIVWEYRVPFKAGGTLPQGEVLSVNQNITFQMKRYPADYAAFQGKDLSARGLLEELNFTSDVGDTGTVTSLVTVKEEALQVFPNPFSEVLYVLRKENAAAAEGLKLYSVDGQLVKQLPPGRNEAVIYTGDLPKGIYLGKAGRQIIRLVKH